eukprot:m.12700 g.12700  ORF g.12700 m.12700 type:complete len:117 (-) comp4574_c0_seq1:97-447(-)
MDFMKLTSSSKRELRVWHKLRERKLCSPIMSTMRKRQVGSATHLTGTMSQRVVCGSMCPKEKPTALGPKRAVVVHQPRNKLTFGVARDLNVQDGNTFRLGIVRVLVQNLANNFMRN